MQVPRLALAGYGVTTTLGVADVAAAGPAVTVTEAAIRLAVILPPVVLGVLASQRGRRPGPTQAHATA